MPYFYLQRRNSVTHPKGKTVRGGSRPCLRRGRVAEASVVADLHAFLPWLVGRAARLDAIDAANRGVERLRHLVRVAHACKGISHARYGFAAEALDGIGRQLGGWRRSEAGKA